MVVESQIEKNQVLHHSTDLSGGNQVDGSPPTRHTKVVGHDLDPRKWFVEWKFLKLEE